MRVHGGASSKGAFLLVFVLEIDVFIAEIGRKKSKKGHCIYSF